MASVTPQYWGCAQYSIGRRYFEFDGAEGIVQQWLSVIATQPDWVEIVTWNDFNESTYLAPIEDPAQYSAHLGVPRRNTHKGYFELSKRFIQWYKTGIEPSIDREALFFFYRTHTKAAIASNTKETPVAWHIGDVKDLIYVTTFLLAPAELEVRSGGSVNTLAILPGMNHVRTPFSAGALYLTLRREGREVLSIRGPDIDSKIAVYNYFSTSGFAYGEESPRSPVNLRSRPGR
jgi:hypothetical protein